MSIRSSLTTHQRNTTAKNISDGTTCGQPCLLIRWCISICWICEIEYLTYKIHYRLVFLVLCEQECFSSFSIWKNYNLTTSAFHDVILPPFGSSVVEESSRENLLTFRICSRNSKKLGVTTLVSEISCVVDHAKLPHLVIDIAVVGFIYFSEKNESLSTTGRKHCHEIQFEWIHYYSRLLQ